MPNSTNSNPRNIKVEIGIVEGEATVHYIFPDGSELYKIGGSKAWRNNNPGNVGCSPDVEEYLGSVGCDPGGLSIFPDYQTGDDAMARMLRNWKNYRDKTLEDAVKTYAPELGGNPTESYIDFIVEKTGLSRDTAIKEMTDYEFDSFREAIKEFERTTPGTEVRLPIEGGAYYLRNPVNVDKNKHYDPSHVDYNTRLRKDFGGMTDSKDVTNKTSSIPGGRSSTSSMRKGSSQRKPPHSTYLDTNAGSRRSRHQSSGGGCRETLERQGDRVYRKEKDCSTRGFFYS